jgi:hypothetical protein
MKIKDLSKTRVALTERWDAINRDIQHLALLDQEKKLLNLQARKILTDYLDRFKELAASPAEPKVYRELARLLDSLEYLIKILSKRGKKKRPLI